MGEIFRRVEKKYILNKKQYLTLKDILNNTMVEDEHGKSTICNIYFDSEQYDLIRNSISKPIFKDKIRLRSYNTPQLESKVFLEIKRKYDGVVGKRRIAMKLSDYYKMKIDEPNSENQITNELSYYFNLYHLEPKVYLSYNRRAYYDKKDRDLRITFDSNIIARTYDLKLDYGSYGDLILDKDEYIMEIKTLGAMPIWLVNVLNNLGIVPGSFSKYGTAYKNLILNQQNLERKKVANM